MSHVRGKVLNGCMSIQTPFTRMKLVEIKRKAVRRGIWFTALSRTERACIDLTVKVVDRVRSLLLTKVLTKVVQKLSEVMENKIARLMREVGHELALKLSRIAQTWGNSHATEWAADPEFIRYLAIIKMNSAEANKT